MKKIEQTKEMIPTALRVSAKSKPNSVAGMIALSMKKNGMCELQAVGAGAVNQAIKAVAIARGFTAPTLGDLSCVPSFAEIELEGEQKTSMKLIVKTA